MHLFFIFASTVTPLHTLLPSHTQRILFGIFVLYGFFWLFYACKKRPLKEPHHIDPNRYISIKREALSRIPKQQKQRKSPVADTCYAKISTARTMAELIRNPLLRKHVLEICDLANIVTDTICYTKSDTVSAGAFAHSHLEKLLNEVEHCFKIYRCKEYSHIKKIDLMNLSDLHHFDAFIASFTKQQRLIIEENNSPLGTAASELKGLNTP